MDAILRIKDELKRFCPDKTPCVVKDMEHAVLFSVNIHLSLENNVFVRRPPNLPYIKRNRQKLRYFKQLP